jgi:hypothetical protein
MAGKRSWQGFDPSMRRAAADTSEIREALRSA